MQYDILYPESASVVKFNLRRGETIVAESDAMIAMSTTVLLEAQRSGSFAGALFRKLVSHESFFLQKMTAQQDNAMLMIGHRDMGGIESVELDGNVGLIVQKGGFLAYHGDVDIDTKNQGVLKGLFSSEGIFLLHLKGRGTVFVSSFGAIHPFCLKSGEEIIVDNGHLVAWSDTCSYDVETASRNLIDAITSGECVACHFRGPGVVLVQTRNEGMFANYLGGSSRPTTTSIGNSLTNSINNSLRSTGIRINPDLF